MRDGPAPSRETTAYGKARMAIALAILGVLCIGYGMTVMAIWSGTGFFAVWYALGVALLSVAWCLHSGTWERIPIIARRLVEAIGCVLLAGILVFGGMSLSGFGATGEDDLDYLIVLGAQVREDRPSTVLQHRLDRAAAYLEQNPDTICIVTGGQGFNEPRPEADVMAEYLESQHVDPTRIVRENQARNTDQNIEFSMAFLDPADDRVGIVTNDFHVFRGTRIARKKGLAHVCGISAPSNPWYLPNNVLRECFGIAKGFATGTM